MPSRGRTLSTKKCTRCRISKVKCSPQVRDWPAEKCHRCIKSGEPCSPNMTAREARRGTHPVSAGTRARSSDLASNSPAESEGEAESDRISSRDLSPLMSAIALDNARVVEILLRAGSDPNETYDPAGTCLEFAVHRGSRSIVEMLLKFGAEVDAEGTRYRNALHAAIERDEAEIIEILVQHGAAVNKGGRLRDRTDGEQATLHSVGAKRYFGNVETGASLREDEASVSRDEEFLDARSPNSFLSSSTHAARSYAGNQKMKKPRVLRSFSSSDHIIQGIKTASLEAVPPATGSSSRLPTANINSAADFELEPFSPHIDDSQRSHDDLQDCTKHSKVLRQTQALDWVEELLRAELPINFGVDTISGKETVSVSPGPTSTGSKEQGSSENPILLEDVSHSKDWLNNHSEFYYTTTHGNGPSLSSEYCSKATSHSGTPLSTKDSNTNRSQLSSPNLDSSSYMSASFTCEFIACRGYLFQTEDLLESHINVQHCCLIGGCARSQGRKGFTDAMEKDRHLLLHSDEGYSCPFCREPEVNPSSGLSHLQSHIYANHINQGLSAVLLQTMLEEVDYCLKYQ